MKAAILLVWQALLCLEIHARMPLEPPPEYSQALDNGTFGYYPTRLYETEKDLKSPETNFVQWSPQCDDGLYTFLTPRGWSLQEKPGPMILDGRGEMVWAHHYHNDFGGEGYNFLAQKYKGEDILSFWLGDDRVRGHGSGYYYLMNSSYQIFNKITAANGLTADLHEFIITPDNTALMSIYEVVPGDISMFREPRPDNKDDEDFNYIWDGIFQEIDIETGELLFEWRASEHFNFTDTYRPIYTMGNRNDAFDWYHINSVHKDELGNYLVSARYTHSLTYIDGKTKETIWQLGGKSNVFMDLSDGNATNFAWQHDAHFHSIDSFPKTYTPPPQRAGYSTQLISVFDNAAEDQHYDYGMPLSRGLLLEVTYPTPGTARAATGPSRNLGPNASFNSGNPDLNAQKVIAINGTDPDYTVRVIKSYENPNWTRSSSQGNMQVIPQGPGEDPKILVGYGLDAVWTEFAADGTVLCDVHYGPKASWDTAHIQSYRIFKLPWKGMPEWEPNVVINDDDSVVLVSWLGATEVREWVLQTSHTSSQKNDADWIDIATLPKVDFETVFQLPSSSSTNPTDTLEPRAPPQAPQARYLRVLARDENHNSLPHGTSKVVDRGIMASYFPSLKDELPEQVARWSPLEIFLVLVANVSVLLIVYELYRRYLSWRMGRPSAGAFRWRKGVGYKFLGEV